MRCGVRCLDYAAMAITSTRHTVAFEFALVPVVAIVHIEFCGMHAVL